MSKPSNPTLIGSFVLGAVALLVVAVLLFGGATLFASKRTLVSYFPSSVQGLREGSSVTLNGVRIGSVSDIRLLAEIKPDASMDSLVEVTMEVLPDAFELWANGRKIGADERSRLLGPEQYVEAGFRARLGTESLVTGQLLVEFEFRPDTNAVFRARKPGGPAEVPTIPGNVEQVLAQLQSLLGTIAKEVDVQKLVHDVQGILSGMNELANSSDLRTMLAGGSRLTNDEIPRLAGSLDRSLNDLQGVTQDVRALVQHVDEQVDPLMADLLPAVRRLDGTLKATELTLQSVSSSLREDSALSADVRNTLQDLQSVSEAATTLLQYLEKHPEALLRGKKQ